VVCAAVAVGWSGYFTPFLAGMGIHLPDVITHGPDATPAGVINLPAIAILFVVAGMLCVGTRESAAVNTVLVVIKLAALLVFLALALPHFDPAHFTPFMPKGFGASTAADGARIGVMAAASIIFFAFYGFDAVSTAAEETKNPARDLAIGVIGSMVVCTALYMAVGAAAVGAMPLRSKAANARPHPARWLSEVVRHRGAGMRCRRHLAFLFGQSRLFVMSPMPARDDARCENAGALRWSSVVTARWCPGCGAAALAKSPLLQTPARSASRVAVA
jgi:APA family basic amino acid/polyamine antiporter